ncbi:MAG: hypothetical protein Q9207_001303 [Kuettlingeria erythrocarpa]
MPKRSADGEEGSSHSKRRRLADHPSLKSNVEEISSAHQLQSILAFKQDAGPETKRCIHAFKIFLESIAYGQDEGLKSTRRRILYEYLQLQPFSHSEDEGTYAFDVVKTWNFAQSNNESLFATVTSVLALFLKAISHHIEFRQYGRSICHLLLQKDHLMLLERALSAQKSKDQLITATLRLLTEIVAFDGGSSAKRVYRAKDTTLKRLDTFLGLRNDVKIAAPNTRRKPSIRHIALRYLFAHLKLQDYGAKIEILGNGKLLRSVFQGIKEDSPSIIHEILDAVKDDILKDEKIPRRIKGRCFTDLNLGSIASLYGYHTDGNAVQGAESSHKPESIPDRAHAFLLSVCTTPDYGLLVAGSAPHTHTQGDEDEKSQFQDNDGLGSLHNGASRPKAIKNHTLASFLQMLRPYADDMQRNLTLAVFQAAPELVGDYFYRRKSFSFDPKLTATWVGLAAFLLSTINLPVQDLEDPSESHSLLPPPASGVLEGILPSPLSSRIVSRCLSQNVSLIKFFAIKILSAAFIKFAVVVDYFRSCESQSRTERLEERWKLGISSLVENFSQRCPDMSHIITVFRNSGPQDIVLREASARLLSLYYRHLPQTALQQKFDASTVLSGAINNSALTAQLLEESPLGSMVLEHLIDVARCSPDIRWWQKPADNRLSLFGSGLRRCATQADESTSRSLETLLQSALVEGITISPEQGNQLMAFMLRSLKKAEEWQPTDTLFEFLDDCLIRLSKKGVMYQQNLLNELATIHLPTESHADYPGGQLLMVVMEQWPFIQQSAIEPDLENISRWLSRFFLLLEQVKGMVQLLGHVSGRIESTTSNKKCKRLLKGSSEKQFALSLKDQPLQRQSPKSAPPVMLQQSRSREVHAPNETWRSPSPPAPEGEDHPGLGKWKQVDVEEGIVDGAVGSLILCLCSKHGDIRKQALMQLRAWMRKLQGSQYSEKEAVYLLAGELVETAATRIADGAIPYFAGVAAAEFCLVLSNPLHSLYAKVNRFLNKAPTWQVEKMPSYWVDQILMHLPTNDDAHYKEMGWLLNLLIEGLRTEADMELYRRCPVVERLLSLFASPSLQPPYQERILTFLFRCSHVNGSTTLITRYSLLSWVRSAIAEGTVTGPQASALERLARKCVASCDQGRVGDWSGGRIVDTPSAEQSNGHA